MWSRCLDLLREDVTQEDESHSIRVRDTKLSRCTIIIIARENYYVTETISKVSFDTSHTPHRSFSYGSGKDLIFDSQPLYSSRAEVFTLTKVKTGVLSVWFVQLPESAILFTNIQTFSLSSCQNLQLKLKLVLFKTERGGVSGPQADLWISSYVLSVVCAHYR